MNMKVLSFMSLVLFISQASFAMNKRRLETEAAKLREIMQAENAMRGERPWLLNVDLSKLSEYPFIPDIEFSITDDVYAYKVRLDCSSYPLKSPIIKFQTVFPNWNVHQGSGVLILPFYKNNNDPLGPSKVQKNAHDIYKENLPLWMPTRTIIEVIDRVRHFLMTREDELQNPLSPSGHRDIFNQFKNAPNEFSDNYAGCCAKWLILKPVPAQAQAQAMALEPEQTEDDDDFKKALLLSQQEEEAKKQKAAEIERAYESQYQSIVEKSLMLQKNLDNLKAAQLAFESSAPASPGSEVVMKDAPPQGARNAPAEVANQADADGYNKNECDVCLDNAPNAVFTPCGHIVCCYDCAIKVKLCVLCRQPVDKVFRAYMK